MELAAINLPTNYSIGTKRHGTDYYTTKKASIQTPTQIIYMGMNNYGDANLLQHQVTASKLIIWVPFDTLKVKDQVLVK